MEIWWKHKAWGQDLNWMGEAWFVEGTYFIMWLSINRQHYHETSMGLWTFAFIFFSVWILHTFQRFLRYWDYYTMNSESIGFQQHRFPPQMCFSFHRAGWTFSWTQVPCSFYSNFCCFCSQIAYKIMGFIISFHIWILLYFAHMHPHEFLLYSLLQQTVCPRLSYHGENVTAVFPFSLITLSLSCFPASSSLSVCYIWEKIDIKVWLISLTMMVSSSIYFPPNALCISK